MDREELSKRYREAQFHSKALAAEHASQDTLTTDDTGDETEDQTPAQILVKFAGLQRVQDVGPGLTDDDRLRRYAGLRGRQI